MKRIGVAASKIARGNMVLYNCYVILLSFLFSLLTFAVAGSAVLFALIFLSYLGSEMMIFDPRSLTSVVRVSVIALTVVVSVFTIASILTNIKFRKTRD